MIIFFEFYYYRSGVFSAALKERVIGWVLPLDIFTIEHKGGSDFTLTRGVVENANSLMSRPDFWYGLVFAAVLVAGAVYIRRYRDES